MATYQPTDRSTPDLEVSMDQKQLLQLMAMKRANENNEMLGALGGGAAIGAGGSALVGAGGVAPLAGAAGMLYPSSIGEEDFSQNARMGNVELPREMKQNPYDPQGGPMMIDGLTQSAAQPPYKSNKAMLNKIVQDRIKQQMEQEDDGFKDRAAAAAAYHFAYPQGTKGPVKASIYDVK